MQFFGDHLRSDRVHLATSLQVHVTGLLVGHWPLSQVSVDWSAKLETALRVDEVEGLRNASFPFGLDAKAQPTEK